MALHARSAEARAAAKVDYGTPREVYAALDELFHFTIDLAAQQHNTKHARFWSPETNSLAQSWEAETGWLNPPYGRGISQWLAKARSSAIVDRAIIAQLIHANVGSAWWRKYVMGQGLTDAGQLRESYWVPETQVLWLRWEALITGVHVWPTRITFDGAPPEEGAMFDNALVWHASPNRKAPAASRDPSTLLWRWPR